MPQVHVIGFRTAAGQEWGVIVIPPRNSKPWVFVKDFQCAIPHLTRKKGGWLVRRGSTTDPGMPEDLARITQVQTQVLLEPLREGLKNFQI